MDASRGSVQRDIWARSRIFAKSANYFYMMESRTRILSLFQCINWNLQPILLSVLFHVSVAYYQVPNMRTFVFLCCGQCANKPSVSSGYVVGGWCHKLFFLRIRSCTDRFRFFLGGRSSVRAVIVRPSLGSKPDLWTFVTGAEVRSGKINANIGLGRCGVDTWVQ